MRTRSKIISCLARALAIGAALMGILQPASAAASELKIATHSAYVPDPHAQWSATLMYFYSQYLGLLTDLDENDKVYLKLAQSLKPLSDNLWEVKLRPGLKFSNGEPLTMKDVAASYARARTLPKSTYSGLFVGINEFKILDDLTMHIVTSEPYPTIPAMLTQLMIVPKEIAETATAADFASPKANASSGPYKFVQYLPGDRLILERNEHYFGEKARWDRVTFRFIGAGAARVAALLSGDVDLIDNVPPGDVAALKKNPNVSVFSGAASAVNFFVLDSGRDVTPFITNASGEPIKPNPLKDVRVRRALSLAIDRGLIRDRVMDGFSFVNNQIVRQGFGGFADDLPADKFDLPTAQTLMKEAGFGDGFNMTIHCPEGRYPNGSEICQAAAQFFARLRIKASVEMLPRSIFFSRMTDPEGQRGTFMLFGFGASSGGEATILQQGIHTYDRQRRLGAWNMGRYSNPAIDAIIQKSLVEMDAPKRFALQADAMKKAMEDVAVIPFQSQPVIVATRRNLRYEVQANAYTLAEATFPVEAGK